MRLRFEKCLNSRVFKDPLQKINEKNLILDKFIKSLENSILKKVKDYKLIFAKNTTKLDGLSPLKTLSRGYSITTSKTTNKVVKSSKDVKSGDELEIKVEDGKINATVN